MGDFFGLRTRTVGNAHLRLEFLADAGPRIVRLFPAASSENVLVELPELKIEIPGGNYSMRGGHRMWYAPEAFPRSYLPDDSGLVIEEFADGVRLVQPTEQETGMRKSIEIHLDATRAAATITHRLQNDGAQPVEYAPWAITQLPLGGVGILPQRTKPVDERALLSNRLLVLWSYTRWHDARLELNDDCIIVHGRAQLPPCKIGYFNDDGWIAYLRQGVLFVKHFQPQIEQVYPDHGCNAEVYCNDVFFELETLGTLARLEPGQAAVHVETWEVYANLPTAPTELRALRKWVEQIIQ